MTAIRFFSRVPAAVCYGYILIIALIQQFGYWNTFGLNILQYATLMDLAKYSVWPLMSLAGLAALSMTAQGISLLSRVEWRRATSMKEGVSAGARTFWARWWWIVAAGIFFLSGSIYAVVHENPSAWPSFAVVVGLLAYALMYVLGVDPLKGVVRDQPARRLLTCVLLIAPFAMWGIGKQRASDIMKGRHYTQASLPFDLLTANSLPPGQKLRYLGSTADYSFFFNHPEESVLVVRNESLAGFTLQARDKEDPSLSEKWLAQWFSQ